MMPKALRPSLILLALSLLAMPAMALDAPTADDMAASAGSFRLMAGVVVDSQAKIIYSMGANGEVEALSVDDGRLLWTSAEAARPLALYGHYLLAQVDTGNRGSLDLLFLDVEQSGHPAARSSMELAPGVEGRVDDAPGRRFEVVASIVSGLPVLDWSFESRLITGADPSQIPGANEVEQRVGRLVFDPASETWAPQAALRGGTGQPRPDLDATERLPAIEGTQFLSADGGHVMTSERVADVRVFDRYRWRLFSRPSGAVRGEIRAAVSFAPYAVVGSVMVHESTPYQRRVGDEMTSEPRKLVAFDLGNGRPLWSRPVRDTEYRGPFPP